MTTYVAEIYGRGIVAFDAANNVEAQHRLSDGALLRDLRVCQNHGHTLWDGVSPIGLREALPEEMEIWRARGPALSAGRSWRAFLVPVVDPSSFDDDDDSDDYGD